MKRLRFLKQIDRETPKGLEGRFIVDNYRFTHHTRIPPVQRLGSVVAGRELRRVYLDCRRWRPSRMNTNR